MSIKLIELWPPRDGMQKIPVYKDGGIAVFCERMIFQSPVKLRKGLLECRKAYDHITIDPANNDREAQLVRVGWNLIDTSLRPQ